MTALNFTFNVHENENFSGIGIWKGRITKGKEGPARIFCPGAPEFLFTPLRCAGIDASYAESIDG